MMNYFCMTKITMTEAYIKITSRMIIEWERYRDDSNMCVSTDVTDILWPEMISNTLNLFNKGRLTRDNFGN